MSVLVWERGSNSFKLLPKKSHLGSEAVGVGAVWVR